MRQRDAQKVARAGAGGWAPTESASGALTLPAVRPAYQELTASSGAAGGSGAWLGMQIYANHTAAARVGGREGGAVAVPASQS